MLRYLGRGFTVDDLYEETTISEETIRKFIHRFILYGSTTLYHRYVVKPSTSEDLADCNLEFKMAGLPGCIGSTDATHVVMERCAYRLRQLHMGYKLSHTARTYNLTVNHRQRILSSTEGHPARYNDKTLILFDRFMNKIRRGEYNKNFEFELYDKGPNGEVITIKYCGCYVIVDNGYLKWSTTVPPMKNTNSRREIRFSD